MKIDPNKTACENFKDAILELLWQRFVIKAKRGDYGEITKLFVEAKKRGSKN